MDWSDPAFVLAIVGTWSLGFMVGVHFVTRRASKAPSYLCSCKHELSSHNPTTGACNDEDYQGGTEASPAGWVPCRCVRYIGPRPLPELDEVLRGVGNGNA